MDEELRPMDFVDYDAIFADALSLVSKGSSVSEAIDASLKEKYALTYRDIGAETRLILEHLKQENDWGPVRALRELAETPGLADAIRGQKNEGLLQSRSTAPPPDPAVADYPRVFAKAQRRRQSGFSLEDSLDMASRELYPQTFKKVREQALSYIRLFAEKEGMHELRALRELAEDGSILSRLEDQT
jgi:hypothetical protein